METSQEGNGRKGIPLPITIIWTVLAKCSCGATGQPLAIATGSSIQVQCKRCKHKVTVGVDAEKGPFAFDEGLGLEIVRGA